MAGAMLTAGGFCLVVPTNICANFKRVIETLGNN